LVVGCRNSVRMKSREIAVHPLFAPLCEQTQSIAPVPSRDATPLAVLAKPFQFVEVPSLGFHAFGGFHFDQVFLDRLIDRQAAIGLLRLFLRLNQQSQDPAQVL
jgi:hypothetical protein